MRKHIAIIPLLSVCLLTQAQNVADAFAAMPGSVAPLLSDQMRMELIEYGRMGRTDTVRNALDGNAHTIELDTVGQYMRLQITDNSEMQIKLVRNDTSHIIATIETTCGPVCSSVVSRYTKKWKMIDQRIALLDTDQFLNLPPEMSPDERHQASTLLQAVFVRADFMRESDSIRFSNQAAAMLSPQLRAKYEPYLTEVEMSIKAFMER